MFQISRVHPAVILLFITATTLGIGCGSSPTAPSARRPVAGTAPPVAGSAATYTSQGWGPEHPSFNLEVILRGEGFGLVKFRQPNDGALIVYLDTWVRDLQPNTDYLLQRAVDSTVDDDCTSTNWLTLGKGLQPQSITTDASGTGREELFRNLAAFAPGTELDIHFRVVNEATAAVALRSECYQFRISQ